MMAELWNFLIVFGCGAMFGALAVLAMWADATKGPLWPRE